MNADNATEASSGSATQTKSSAISEHIQILKVSVYGARNSQMTCWAGKSESSARDELYRIGSGENPMEVDAVYHWETMLLSLTEPCTVPGTDLAASEVQLDMWEDAVPGEEAEDRVVEDGIPAEIHTEDGSLLAPTNVRKDVYVHFFQYVEDGSPYGVPGPVCRKMTRSGCTVTGPVEKIFEDLEGSKEAAGDLMIAVPGPPARLGQSQQTGQPEQSEISGGRGSSETSSTTWHDQQSWHHLPISYLFEDDFWAISLDEDGSGRFGRIRRYPPATYEELDMETLARRGEAPETGEYPLEWTSEGGELIALTPLHLDPFPNYSDSSGEVDMEVDGPAARDPPDGSEAGGAPES